jgi:uncharacterized RDD family membrane protein YckC
MNESPLSKNPAGPLRRLGAMLYDFMLVVAVLMILTALFLLFTHGEAVTKAGGFLLYAYRAAVSIAYLSFFGVFWTQRGQTLGMQAWRLRIETAAGDLPSWSDVIKRILAATVPWLPGCIVLGVALQAEAKSTLRLIGAALLTLVLINYLAAWFDPQRRSIHDRWLGTRIVHRG